MNLISAMAKQEGFFVDGSRCKRNNNPLNIVSNDYTKKYQGYNGSDGTFCKFKTLNDGWNAAKRLLSIPAVFENQGTDQEKLVSGYKGAMLKQVINRWTTTDQAVYLMGVVASTNLQETTIITDEIINRP